jgi:hypothetical protein
MKIVTRENFRAKKKKIPQQTYQWYDTGPEEDEYMITVDK